MKRPKYSIGLATAARRCLMDEARTPYAAAKELQQRGVRLVTLGERQHIVRTIGGEGLAIVRNARSWPLHDGRTTEPRSELQRDAEFFSKLRGAQL